MRKLIAIILGMFIWNAAHSTTQQQAVAIYNKIVKANNFWIYPRLRFSDDKQMNAHSSWQYITIDQGMLDKTNVDELALVIGHELAHYKLLHKGSTPARELAADALGWKYADKAGYDCHKGKEYLKKLYHKKGSKTHPPPMERYNKLP